MVSNWTSNSAPTSSFRIGVIRGNEIWCIVSFWYRQYTFKNDRNAHGINDNNVRRAISTARRDDSTEVHIEIKRSASNWLPTRRKKLLSISMWFLAIRVHGKGREWLSLTSTYFQPFLSTSSSSVSRMFFDVWHQPKIYLWILCWREEK